MMHGCAYFNACRISIKDDAPRLSREDLQQCGLHREIQGLPCGIGEMDRGENAHVAGPAAKELQEARALFQFKYVGSIRSWRRFFAMYGSMWNEGHARLEVRECHHNGVSFMAVRGSH